MKFKGRLGGRGVNVNVVHNLSKKEFKKLKKGLSKRYLSPEGLRGKAYRDLALLTGATAATAIGKKGYDILSKKIENKVLKEKQPKLKEDRLTKRIDSKIARLEAKKKKRQESFSEFENTLVEFKEHAKKKSGIGSTVGGLTLTGLGLGTVSNAGKAAKLAGTGAKQMKRGAKVAKKLADSKKYTKAMNVLEGLTKVSRGVQGAGLLSALGGAYLTQKGVRRIVKNKKNELK